MARKTGECVYCGAVGPIHADHIPPRSLFAPPRPRLVTVPACFRCNNEASKDDEYFRLVCSASSQAADHPDASAVWPAAFRGLTKPNKTGFRRAFLEASQLVEVRTKGGVYLGDSMAFDVDLRRLSKVVARAVRGLFFHHTGSRLPYDPFFVKVYSVDGIRGTAGVKSTGVIVSKLLNIEPSVVGRGVFTYRYHLLEEAPSASAWLLSVYEAIHFVGLTGRDIGRPPDSRPPAE